MRYFNSTAQPMSLTAGINNTDLTLRINDTAGLPTSTPFTLVAEPGTAAEEIITVNAVAGLILTVLRGEDGSSAQPHAAGAAIRHMMTARDLREPQQHIAAATGVHGLGASTPVVGTDTAQTLTNKSLSGATNTVTNLPTTSLVDSAITTLKVAPLAVTTAKIADANITTAKIADAAVTTVKVLDSNVTKAKLAADALAFLIPTGALLPFAGAAAPTGFLLADGTAVSRTTYATLFAVVGTQHGAGDGSTTFNVPDMRGRVIGGYDNSQTEFNALGKTGGEKTHVLTVPEMPSHTHVQDPHTHTTFTGNVSTTVAPAAGSGVISTANTGVTAAATATNQNTGGGTAHNNLQPYLALNFVIKT